MADVQVMSLAARPEPEGASGCKVWETAGGPSDVQTRIAIVGVSLGTVLFASVSNVGRWLSLLAGPTVLTWLVVVCIGRKPWFVFLPALYAFVFAFLFGLAEGWGGGAVVTAALALSGLAAGGALLARSVVRYEDG